jgi:hypothetical protein
MVRVPDCRTAAGSRPVSAVALAAAADAELPGLGADELLQAAARNAVRLSEAAKRARRNVNGKVCCTIPPGKLVKEKAPHRLMPLGRTVRNPGAAKRGR